MKIKNKHKRLCMAAAAVLFLVLVTVAAMYEAGYIGNKVVKDDPNAETGYLHDLDEDMKESLEQKAAEDELRVSMNTAPVFQNGKSEGNLRIQNASGNRYDMRVQIILVGDRNRIIYESGILNPGEHIENAKLDVNLASGKYTAAAIFIGVDPNTKEDLGQVQMDIVLQILE